MTRFEKIKQEVMRTLPVEWWVSESVLIARYHEELKRQHLLEDGGLDPAEENEDNIKHRIEDFWKRTLKEKEETDAKIAAGMCKRLEAQGMSPEDARKEVERIDAYYKK